MSFAEKSKILVIDDEDQWKIFREMLIKEGVVTNLSTQQLLIEFVKERERIVRIQEGSEKTSDVEKKEPPRKSLKESLLQLGDSVGSIKEHVIGSHQEDDSMINIAIKKETITYKNGNRRLQHQERRNLRDSLEKIGNGAKFLKLQIIDSFQDEELFEGRSNKRIVSSVAA